MNIEVMNLVVNVAMLGVWILYFNLLYATFRRQNRPNILVSRSAGEDLGSHCVVSNMSSSAIYLLAVTLEVGVNGRHWRQTVSDVDRLRRGESAGTRIERTRQGPIDAGGSIDIGTFGDLVGIALARSRSDPAAPRRPDALDWLRVTVTAVYTAESDLIGATRGFHITDGRLVPIEALARQITSRRGRAALRRALGAEPAAKPARS